MNLSHFIFSRSTEIQADESIPAVHHAAEILRRDMRDGLTAQGQKNVIRVEILPEAGAERYIARVTSNEILLSCGDDLGAAYALLSISEKFLKVKPLGWWMGLKPEKFETVSIPCQEWQSPEYAVRYRCWFANDEVLFTGWHLEEAQRYNVWKRLFETILRCGGNMVIPGTDREYDGRMLNEMALDMGLWITQHHTELLGAKMFGRVYPDLQPSYSLYPEKFEALWQASLNTWAGKRVVWTIGFRGQGDCAFWHTEDGYDTAEKQGGFISKVMRRQMELVRSKDPNAVFSTNLYGEMMSLYRQGHLQIPENVIKIWGDNGFGKMVSRRQNNDNPRVDALPGENERGQQGIYYHVSFYDLQAANHITMLQNSPRMIVEELTKVLQRSGGTLWNINVGSVKPHIFMLEIVRQMWRKGSCDVEMAARKFSRDYYGSEMAAPALLQYAESSVHYGPNEDDRAGDQFYHFPLRTMARALMRGEITKPVKSLLWAADEADFESQVKRFASIATPGINSWKRYLKLCHDIKDELTEENAIRLDETMILQGIIHHSGCESVYAFGQGCIHAIHGNDLQAYLWTDRALQANRRAEKAMSQVSGRFAHIYDNDCFVGVALTGRVLEALRSWLRIRGDGDLLYDWEKRYLVPLEENRVMLQTHRTVQLTDEELCLRLRGEVELDKAF